MRSFSAIRVLTYTSIAKDKNEAQSSYRDAVHLVNFIQKAQPAPAHPASERTALPPAAPEAKPRAPSEQAVSLPVTPPSSAPIDEARAVDAAQTPASYLVTPPSLAPTPSAVAPAPPEPGLGEAAKIEARARLEADKAKTHTLEKIAELGALVTRLTGQVKDLQDKVQTLSTGSEEKFACRIAFNRGLISLLVQSDGDDMP